MDKKISDIIEQLSPIELKIVPHLNLSISEIEEKSGLDKTSVLRALKFLENKGLVKITTKTKSIIDLGTNGIYYKKTHLPERKLLIFLESTKPLPLEEAKKASKLSDNEFKVSLGVLKKKAQINLVNGKIALSASKAELANKSLEEQLIEAVGFAPLAPLLIDESLGAVGHFWLPAPPSPTRPACSRAAIPRVSSR